VTSNSPHPAAPPALGPHPTVSEVFASDVVGPSPTLAAHEWVDQGDGDVDRTRYWSADWHRLEMERVWRRVWQVACREEDIPRPGDHVVYEVGEESLIVVRTASKEVKAFYNSCLHRGRELREEGGRVARFVCPFHGWTWDLDGTLAQIPAQWDFRHVDPSTFCLPQAHVDTWGGFVFVNMDAEPEPLLRYLDPLPAEFAEHPLEERYKAAHVRKLLPCNWKVALEAFAEAYHVVRTHPQGRAFSGDLNSQYVLWPGARHVSRMITLLGVPSPDLRAVSDESIIEVLRPKGATLERRPDESPRQYAARLHRAHYARKMRADLSGFSDAEILDAIQYHVFPNFSPWAGIGQPITYLWRPYGDDPGTSVMDVMLLQPLPDGGERPEPAPVHLLGMDEPWSCAPELGKYTAIFEQDSGNFAQLQRGVRHGRKGNTYAVYQESKIRHFHRTLDAYMAARA